MCSWRPLDEGTWCHRWVPWDPDEGVNDRVPLHEGLGPHGFLGPQAHIEGVELWYDEAMRPGRVTVSTPSRRGSRRQLSEVSKPWNAAISHHAVAPFAEPLEPPGLALRGIGAVRDW